MDIRPLAPEHVKAFRNVRALVAAYAALSVVALAFIAVFHNNAGLVTDAAWVRGSIVVVSALVTYLFAARAAKGSRPAYRRLRIIATVMVVAIAVIISIPGAFPMWMRVEQGVCGLLLLGVVLLLNGRQLKELFAAK